MENTSKILVYIIFIILILYIFLQDKNELFIYPSINLDIKINKYKVRKYNILEVDNKTFKIWKSIRNNKKQIQNLDNRLLEIYREIKINDDFKNSLLFLNLINKEGFPIFIKENKDILLQNQIKIFLVSIPYEEYNKIINSI
jgi:hypothetical protein